MDQRLSVCALIAAGLSVIAGVSGIPARAQTGPRVKIDPEHCDACKAKTTPSPEASIVGGVRWFSDADGVDPARVDITKDSFCIIRSVDNQSNGPADYRWDVANMQNPNLPSGWVDKVCDRKDGVANPPAPGPIKVNYAPEGPTRVWKGVVPAAATANAFADQETSIDTALFDYGEKPEPLHLSITSHVQRNPDGGYSYSYTFSKGTSGSASYTLELPDINAEALGAQFRARGLPWPIDINKIGIQSVPAVLSGQGPPVRNGRVVLRRNSSPAHTIQFVVAMWHDPTPPGRGQ